MADEMDADNSLHMLMRGGLRQKPIVLKGKRTRAQGNRVLSRMLYHFKSPFYIRKKHDT